MLTLDGKPNHAPPETSTTYKARFDLPSRAPSDSDLEQTEEALHNELLTLMTMTHRNFLILLFMVAAPVSASAHGGFSDGEFSFLEAWTLIAAVLSPLAAVLIGLSGAAGAILFGRSHEKQTRTSVIGGLVAALGAIMVFCLAVAALVLVGR
jgi:hypothetical protein